MLQAYFDESGTHGDSPVFALGGLVATEKHWERLSRSWSKLLSRHSLKYFHTVDCAHGTGEFAGWTQEQRGDLYVKLVRLVVKHAAFRLWSVVPMEDARLVFTEKGEIELYRLCLWACAGGIRWFSHRRGELLACTFESGGKGGNRALRVYETDSEYFGITTLQLANKRRFPPLQAADVHAYELYKYFADGFHGAGRKPRRSFLELLKIQEAPPGGVFWSEENLGIYYNSVRMGAPFIPVERSSLMPNDRIVVKRRDTSGEGA